MPLENLPKLEKLKIKAYKARTRSESDLVGTFDAMFNPESFNQRYEIQYGRGQGLGSSDQEAAYSRHKPSDLKLNLLVDGTGVDELGVVRLGGHRTVSERVDEFLQLTFQKNGEIHEPNYLVVEWGVLKFRCRLGSVDISYTSFNRDGKPLRAELDVTLVSDSDPALRLAQDKLGSPDVTHTRVVRDGDTLPLLTKEIYGTSEHYLRVARANQLDNFRNLTPGQELIFPPLET